VLHATGAKAYRFVKRLFALPSIELIYKSMSAITKFNEDILLAMENIPRAMERWPYQWDIAPNEIVHVVLAGDAAVFNPEMLPQFPYPKPSNNIHLFLVLPLKPRLRSFVVHLALHPAGSLGQKGRNYSQDVVELLKQSNVDIISFSSDGDRGHCPYQASLLSRYEELLLSRCDIAACYVVAFDRDNTPDPPIWWIANCLHELICQ
jgi:hypothetical protein